MKKTKPTDELRNEYSREDLGTGTRGKYYSKFKDASNVVILEPEVAAVFPNEKAVNDALKSLIKMARDTVHK